ncbi:MAG: hypothetical protein Q3983_08795 [Capnocytophaga sp.]|nr:hypothetical protein [Capnocytophaga sp.]
MNNITELEKALKGIDTTPHSNGLRDGVIYYNEKGDFCVYNHYSACEWLKHLAVRYGGVTMEEATRLVETSDWMRLPESIDEVFFITHRTQDDWAMMLVKGNMYWTHSDYVPIKYDEAFMAWEEQIAQQYKLNKEYEYGDLEPADYKSGILDNAIIKKKKKQMLIKKKV